MHARTGCSVGQNLWQTGGLTRLAPEAESVGIDVKLHGSGPPHHHLMAAVRNGSYYEFGGTHPDMPNYGPPARADGYSDGFPAAIDAEGCACIPMVGPGRHL